MLHINNQGNVMHSNIRLDFIYNPKLNSTVSHIGITLTIIKQNDFPHFTF